MIEKPVFESEQAKRTYELIKSGKRKSLAEECPELAKEWDFEKNIGFTPDMFLSGSHKEMYWICPLGHSYPAIIYERVRSKTNNNCPFCSNRQVLVGFNDLATTHPALATQWHPDKNGDLTPQMVTAGSDERVYWQCEHGHYWKAQIKKRVSGNKCRYCTGKEAWSGFNDLTTTHSSIVAEWHPTKNIDKTPQNFTAGSHELIWWKCSFCGHEWPARIDHRTSGEGCPHCTSNGTSKPQLTVYYYALKYLGSDVIHRDKSFGAEFDIYSARHNVCIEYDGWYWHKNKLKKDLAKNKLCQNNGIKPYHIRELPLNSLDDDISTDYLYDYNKKDEFSKVLSLLFSDILKEEIKIDIVKNESEINEFIKKFKNKDK